MFDALKAASQSGRSRMVETGSFGDDPGALRMLSYIPVGLPAGAPLVVVLHGCTQGAEAHAEAAGWLALAERYGFAVLAPEQRVQNNPNRCFNWFEPGDSGRDRGEAASIRSMVGAIIGVHKLDPSRVFVTGLSAGGAMTSILLASYPDVFAGGAIIAGLPFGAADTMQSAFQAMQGKGLSADDSVAALRQGRHIGASTPKVTIWHGDADYTVNSVNADHIARQWVSAHLLQFDNGEVVVEGRRTRTIWRDPQSGETLVESNIVHGLGHGTPLASLGADGVGSAAPFMLEVEISAATEISRFWKITDGGAAPLIDAELIRDPSQTAAQTSGSISQSVLKAISGRIPANVETIIANALKRAGL